MCKCQREKITFMKNGIWWNMMELDIRHIVYVKSRSHLDDYHFLLSKTRLPAIITNLLSAQVNIHKSVWQHLFYKVTSIEIGRCLCWHFVLLTRWHKNKHDKIRCLLYLFCFILIRTTEFVLSTNFEQIKYLFDGLTLLLIMNLFPSCCSIGFSSVRKLWLKGIE